MLWCRILAVAVNEVLKWEKPRWEGLYEQTADLVCILFMKI